MVINMKIVVLAGGISTERDVSLSSGKMIYNAVKKNGHQAVMLDVYFGYEENDKDVIFDLEKDWADEIGLIKDENPDIEQIKAMRTDNSNGFFGPNVIPICQQADLVFMALHGENGENGKIQAAFDLLGIRYTGTDYVSSALCMDKGLSKEIFNQHQVSTPQGLRLENGDTSPCKIDFPNVVKTSCGGSSVGVYIVHNEDEYQKAIKEAFAFEGEVIVEEYIQGREFSVGVIDGKALPVIEIAPISGFYDYKNKYQAGSTIETCPAKLEESLAHEMQRQSELAFRALRLKCYARMDFMMNEKGEVYCLEANTLPGMTPTSLLPQEAAVIGYSFEQLCEWILKISMEKYEA